MTKRIMLFILAVALGGLFAAPLLAPPYMNLPMPSFAEVTGPMTVNGIGSNDPASFGRAFRDQQSGTNSDWITIRCYNGEYTAASVNLSTPALSSGDTSDFALDTSALNTSGISSGQYSDFKVRFTPTSIGNKAAVISFTYETDPYNNPGSYTDVFMNVTGTGTAAAASHLVFRHETSTGPELWHGQYGVDSRAFASRVVDAGASVGVDIWISNEGAGTVTVNPSPLSVASGFALDTSNFSSVLNVGQKTYVTVLFDPQSVVAYNEVITFTHNDGTLISPFEVAVRGSGIDDPLSLRVTDQPGPYYSAVGGPGQMPPAYIGSHIDNNNSAIDLGDVEISTGKQITFTVAHGGLGYLHISGAYYPTADLILGTPASGTSEFVVDASGFSSVLAEANYTTFTVMFTPTATGSFNGSVTLSHDDSSDMTPYVLNFTGNGVVSGGGSSTGSSNGSAGCASSENSDIMLLIVLSLLVAIGIFRLRHRA